jgi:dynein heavy chain
VLSLGILTLKNYTLNKNLVNQTSVIDRDNIIAINDVSNLFKARLDYISEKKKKGKTIASEHLIDELGIDNPDMLTDDKEIEKFIVLRAIKDTNLPKLHETDTMIFEGITEDIFPQTTYSKINSGTFKNLIETVLLEKGYQAGQDFVSRIIYLYQTIMMRHGIMIVGSTMSGKTTAIRTLEQTLKRSEENEFEEKKLTYKYQKAKLMSRKHGKKFKDIKSEEHKNAVMDEIKLSNDDLKMIKAKCKNEGVDTFHINPKSISLGQLMGNFDETSHDWHDGILAYLMRE